jgi:hypothetical protein
MIKRYALIKDNKVENVVIWNTDNGDIQEMTTLITVESEDAQIRDIYTDGQFIRTEIEDDPTQEELIAQKEAQLLEMFEELKRLKGNT